MKDFFIRFCWGVAGFLTMLIMAVACIPFACALFIMVLAFGFILAAASPYAAYLGAKEKSFDGIEKFLDD